ncbi:hypothetical protein OF83DRAFT_1141350, partial [Amylostereum chailletii]
MLSSPPALGVSARHPITVWNPSGKETQIAHTVGNILNTPSSPFAPTSPIYTFLPNHPRGILADDNKSVEWHQRDIPSRNLLGRMARRRGMLPSTYEARQRSHYHGQKPGATLVTPRFQLTWVSVRASLTAEGRLEGVNVPSSPPGWEASHCMHSGSRQRRDRPAGESGKYLLLIYARWKKRGVLIPAPEHLASLPPCDVCSDRQIPEHHDIAHPRSRGRDDEDAVEREGRRIVREAEKHPESPTGPRLGRVHHPCPLRLGFSIRLQHPGASLLSPRKGPLPPSSRGPPD